MHYFIAEMHLRAVTAARALAPASAVGAMRAATMAMRRQRRGLSSSEGKKDMNAFVWDWFSTFLARRLNRVTSFVPPPPSTPPRRALVIHCHPSNDSFSAHLLQTCVSTLTARGTTVKTIRLYGQNEQPKFPAVMQEREWKHYLEGVSNPHLETLTRDHLAMVKEADALVFVYPTWWFGQPAMLKGWLEKVLLPGETFKLGEERFKNSVLGLAPGMDNIKRIAVVTTYGTPWLAVRYVGDPGRRLIARAIRPLCNKDCTVLWLPLYSIDESTEAQRKGFVEKVKRAFQYF